MKKHNSLQKLSESVQTREDYNNLNKKDQQKFVKVYTDKLAQTKEREKFHELLHQLASFISEEEVISIRNQTWETNHRVIMMAVNNYILENYRMPSNTEIGKLTGLSWQTVTKHIHDFNSGDKGTEEQQKFLLGKSCKELCTG